MSGSGAPPFSCAVSLDPPSGNCRPPRRRPVGGGHSTQAHSLAAHGGPCPRSGRDTRTRDVAGFRTAGGSFPGHPGASLHPDLHFPPLYTEDVQALFREAWAFRHLTPDEGLRLYGVIHRVAGLSPGVYRYDPGTGSLRLIRRGDFRHAVYRAGVKQELLLNAALVVIWAVHLEDLGRADGNRELRYAFLDAGMGGTHVYLSGVVRHWGVRGGSIF